MCAKKPKSYAHDKTSDRLEGCFWDPAVFGITTGEENDTRINCFYPDTKEKEQ